MSVAERGLPQDYVEKLPKGATIWSLLREIRRELDGKPVRFFDIETHPDPRIQANIGRFESGATEERIWLRCSLPVHVVEYVIGHELGHLVQRWQNRHPVVTLAEPLARFAVSEDGGLLVPPLVRSLYLLAAGISNIVNDPWADKFAEEHRLLTKPALEFLRERNKNRVENGYGIRFDAQRFSEGVRKALSKVREGVCPTPEPHVCTMSDIAVRATVYVTFHLRYRAFRLFNKLDEVYQTRQPETAELGSKMVRILRDKDLVNPECSTLVAEQLIQCLRVPDGTILVRCPTNDASQRRSSPMA